MDETSSRQLTNEADSGNGAGERGDRRDYSATGNVQQEGPGTKHAANNNDMNPMQQIPTRWTDDNIVELIVKVRNDLLKDFLDERYLKEYVAAQFNVRDLNNIRVEFIRKELKELFNSPIDMVHYEALITRIRDTDTASLSEGNEQLFYTEVERILKRHIYG